MPVSYYANRLTVFSKHHCVGEKIFVNFTKLCNFFNGLFFIFPFAALIAYNQTGGYVTNSLQKRFGSVPFFVESICLKAGGEGAAIDDNIAHLKRDNIMQLSDPGSLRK